MADAFQRTQMTCPNCFDRVIRAEVMLPLGALGPNVDLDPVQILPVDLPRWPPPEGMGSLWIFIEDDLVAVATDDDTLGPFYRRHVCPEEVEGRESSVEGRT